MWKGQWLWIVQLSWSCSSKVPAILKRFCANLSLVFLIKFAVEWGVPTYYPHIYREILLTQQAGKHSLRILSQIVHWYKNLLCIAKTCGKSVIFVCSKHFVNSLSRSALSSNHIVSCSNSEFLFLSTFKRPNLMLPFW